MMLGFAVSGPVEKKLPASISQSQLRCLVTGEWAAENSGNTPLGVLVSCVGMPGSRLSCLRETRTACCSSQDISSLDRSLQFLEWDRKPMHKQKEFLSREENITHLKMFRSDWDLQICFFIFHLSHLHVEVSRVRWCLRSLKRAVEISASYVLLEKVTFKWWRKKNCLNYQEVTLIVTGGHQNKNSMHAERKEARKKLGRLSGLNNSRSMFRESPKSTVECVCVWLDQTPSSTNTRQQLYHWTLLPSPEEGLSANNDSKLTDALEAN